MSPEREARRRNERRIVLIAGALSVVIHGAVAQMSWRSPMATAGRGPAAVGARGTVMEVVRTRVANETVAATESEAAAVDADPARETPPPAEALDARAPEIPVAVFERPPSGTVPAGDPSGPLMAPGGGWEDSLDHGLPG